MLDYKTIEIFTNEEARHQGRPIADAVIQYVRGLKIAARCMVFRGIAGCDESGEVATGRLEVLSFNLPIRIAIVLPAAAADQVLAGLDPLVGSGIIAVHDLTVVSHKAATAFFPRQLAVRDVMTASPASITAERPASEAARLLLSSIFTGLPVVDGKGCPVGVVTQGDLIGRGGLPLRLGLLTESARAGIDAAMAALARRRVEEIMTAPAVTIDSDRPLAEAVELMLARQLKRLPVVDKIGHLAGMLSRLDIFKTVMREAPDWNAFRAQNIAVPDLRTVGDILRRDTLAVPADTPIDRLIPAINTNDLQRVAVVDADGKLLGMIADSDLLGYFKPDPEGLHALFSRLALPLGKDLAHRLANTTAGEIMRTDHPTVRETVAIEEAIRLMIEQRLKRLPVVDDNGRFQGMVSRDSLLRTGFGQMRHRV
ncbi:MAG: DUF190 domain-containing protein [Desulfobulbus sp.]|jgi:CBS domain-containing protein|uniref:DUF190 domain-containing protein n=1 Tax=Desulfobulbus sp. TaxID=895 RepID=UPI00284B2FB9|nr:DUF190 domain-containing protein [Desulfobulbus sp.]MDR2549504.1 DUF190 domain-containing protein [Desulfobulbus sp.]